MFTRIFAIATLATLAIAGGSSTYKCDGGEVKCCNQEFKGATPFKAVSGDSLANAVVSAVANVGLSCNPIGVIALQSGAQCQSQAACCTGEQKGLVNIQCLPIAANVA